MTATAAHTPNGKASVIGNHRHKPHTPSVNPADIHDGLKSFDRWLGWRWVWNERSRKWDKPPIDARTGRPGSSTNAATWCSFEQAMNAHRTGFVDGIGFVLGAADCDVNFAGIDLDDCRDRLTGELSELARDIVETMGTYAEVSPSGTGIKLLCIGTLPAGARTKNKAGTVEIYGSGRYFTVTSQRIDGTPKRVEQRQEQLHTVWQKYIGAEQTHTTNGKPQNKDESGGGVREQALLAMLRIRPDDDEHDGSNRLLAVCCRAVEHELDDGSAIATIRKYEETHPFPTQWSDDDILRRLRDAERKTRRGAGAIRNTTDTGNGERFASQHGFNVRHCHPWSKTLIWDGRRWALDESGEEMRLAKRTARSIWLEAAKAESEATRKRLGDWAAASEKRDRLNAMIALARSEQPIPISVETMDSDGWLLNVENGTVDLHTGQLREHRREDYLTKLCPLEYPTEAGDDPVLWLEFLDRIFAGNAPLIRFVQKLMGLSLVGEVVEHILPICWGGGANGKSVLIETWLGMLGGDYASKAAANLLMTTKHDRHPTELATLHGKRLVAAVESADGSRLSESLMKELTGGDSIQARRMREDFWQFRPSHTVVLATNHKPVIRGTDLGIWRRIRLIPFTVTIPEAEQDKHLASRLRAEWPSILRWAVAGCLDWQRNGLQAPDEVSRATEGYRADSDLLGEFISECCVTGEHYEVQAKVLYARYKAWTEERGEFVETQTRIGLRLAERGLRKEKRQRVFYRGIDVRDG